MKKENLKKYTKTALLVLAVGVAGHAFIESININNENVYHLSKSAVTTAQALLAISRHRKEILKYIKS